MFFEGRKNQRTFCHLTGIILMRPV